ncbi:MAG TPA: NUDIX domain-containing protein [Gammaproteobacteria bacterium]|nr:NUDIX domain-containing protein [Gammaproteobacteria bacterium]
MQKEKTVRAIIINNSHLLTLRPETKDIFFTPGGRVGPDETLQEALLRELSEELPGVACEIGGYLGTVEHRWLEPAREQVTGLHHFYRVYTPALVAPVAPPAAESGLSFVWLHVDELSAYPVQPPSLVMLVPRLLAGGKTLWSACDTGG